MELNIKNLRALIQKMTDVEFDMYKTAKDGNDHESAQRYLNEFGAHYRLLMLFDNPAYFASMCEIYELDGDQE